MAVDHAGSWRVASRGTVEGGKLVGFGISAERAASALGRGAQRTRETLAAPGLGSPHGLSRGALTSRAAACPLLYFRACSLVGLKDMHIFIGRL